MGTVYWRNNCWSCTLEGPERKSGAMKVRQVDKPDRLLTTFASISCGSMFVIDEGAVFLGPFVKMSDNSYFDFASLVVQMTLDSVRFRVTPVEGEVVWWHRV